MPTENCPRTLKDFPVSTLMGCDREGFKVLFESLLFGMGKRLHEEMCMGHAVKGS